MRNPKHLRQIAVRSVQANQFSFDDTNLKVSGYVNETGKASDPIPNWGETDAIPEDQDFVEIMQPGVFEDAIRNADFVDFYLEHEPGKYLSSTREGTLQLSEDSTGLKMSANIVPTSWGKDTYTLIKNNVIKSMSFGFIPEDDQWDLSGDTPVRKVTKLQLLEVSAVRFPAYPDSSIEARKKHFKKLNQMLEKRGLTLKTIHERGVNHMVKTDKKEARANGMASNSLGSADIQNLSSALGNLATSIDNNTNAVQENSEVQKNIAAAVMQSAHGDRSKKDVHKNTNKRDGEADPKAEKPAEPKTDETSKSEKSTEKPKEAPKETEEAKSEKPSKETPKDNGKDEKPEAKETPKKTEDDERAKKAEAEKKAKAEKRSKAVKKMMAGLKDLNETV